MAGHALDSSCGELYTAPTVTVGAVENDRIVWRSWSTPTGLVVDLDRVANGALVSPMPKNLSSELKVVVTRDIQLEFPANLKP